MMNTIKIHSMSNEIFPKFMLVMYAVTMACFLCIKFHYSHCMPAIMTIYGYDYNFNV